MIEFLRNLFRPAPEPVAPITPQPLQVNPLPSARAARAAGRMANLMDAIDQGDKRESVRHSLAVHQATIVAAGLPVPRTADEARALARGEV